MEGDGDILTHLIDVTWCVMKAVQMGVLCGLETECWRLVEDVLLQGSI